MKSSTDTHPVLLQLLLNHRFREESCVTCDIHQILVHRPLVMIKWGVPHVQEAVGCVLGDGHHFLSTTPSVRQNRDHYLQKHPQVIFYHLLVKSLYSRSSS